MSKLDPKLDLEKQLGKQIYNALQGEIVEEVLRKTKTSSRDAYWRSSMEGHSLRVQKELLPDIYELCQDVKKKLKFKDDVDFYITGDSDVNAFSLAAEDEGEHHIVNVNSALFDLMSEDELRFVIGHELGHLINKDTALARLINFVFPEGSAVPVTLQYKIRLHEQLAELVADRYGYMATEDLGVCVTAFFKMASGLDLEKMNVSIEALIADNSHRLDYFLKDKGISRSSHPVNPIRVQALNLFATCKTQEELHKGMDELISILLKVGDDDDFQIMDMKQIMETMTTVTGYLKLLLIAIAAVSLLVGAIGIMNMMLVSVAERTREIGIRKAIGARERHIITQFLSESIMISFIGSMIGLVLGVGLAQGVGRFILGYNVPFSIWPVILSISVAVIVGLASGVMPAIKAAKLNPIDSLRYE